MTKANKILAPTDLSSLSRPAVRYALEIGLDQGAEVIVYYVISVDGDWFGKNDPYDPAGVFVPRQKELLREFVNENFADMVGAAVALRPSTAAVRHFFSDCFSLTGVGPA